MKPFSHATLACYKALSKANPAVSTSGCVTMVETEVYEVGEALGENWTSKNRRSMQVRGGIASVASHSPKSKSCCPINPRRVRAPPRSTSHVLLTTLLPVEEHRSQLVPPRCWGLVQVSTLCPYSQYADAFSRPGEARRPSDQTFEASVVQ